MLVICRTWSVQACC